VVVAGLLALLANKVSAAPVVVLMVQQMALMLDLLQ
jgi:hypothetical protein